jgi:hypothetical protein
VLARAALIVRAPAAKLPGAFQVAGWILVVSALLVLAALIRWHGKYGALVRDSLTPAIILVLAPIAAVAGAGLIYASI